MFASRTETQGLVLLESMLLGVPVVSTAEMGTKDILINGKGALIAKEEVNDFTDKILKIIKDPQLKEILSEEGCEYTKAWQPEIMAERMMSLYESLLVNNTCLSKPHHAC